MQNLHNDLKVCHSLKTLILIQETQVIKNYLVRAFSIIQKVLFFAVNFNDLSSNKAKGLKPFFVILCKSLEALIGR